MTLQYWDGAWIHFLLTLSVPIPRNGQGHVKLSRQKSMSDWSVGINNFNDSIFITKSVFERIHYGIIITEYLTLCICEGNIWPMVKFLSPWTSSCSNMIPIAHYK